MSTELCIESIKKSLARRNLEYVLFTDYDGSIIRFIPDKKRLLISQNQ